MVYRSKETPHQKTNGGAVSPNKICDKKSKVWFLPLRRMSHNNWTKPVVKVEFVVWLC